MQNPEYPIAYVKGDHTQLAGSPAAEVRLRFEGWRRRDGVPAPPSTVAETALTADDDAAEQAAGQRPRRKPSH